MNKNEKYWNERAATYDEKVMPSYSDAYKKTFEKSMAYCKAGDEVLEVACGTGILTLQLAKKVKHITAVDISEEMIAKLRQKAGSDYPNISLLHADIFSSKLDAKTFDVVAAYNVLLYMENIEVVLARIKSLLKPGGIFLSASDCMGGLDTPEVREKKSRVERGDLSYVGFYTTEELCKLIENAGFELLESKNLFEQPPNLFVAARAQK